MEFHENRAKAPFIGLVQLWQAVRRWRRQMQTRRVLQQMSDERLRDIGLRREDVEEGDIDLYIIKRFYVFKLSYKNFPETIHQ